jgi:hypothetical protein
MGCDHGHHYVSRQRDPKKALGFLLGRFSGQAMKSGEHIVPEAALAALAGQNIQFTVPERRPMRSKLRRFEVLLPARFNDGEAVALDLIGRAANLSGQSMSGGIFLIQSDNSLVEMKEQPYDTEAVLQELLAKYPNLLAGDQMDEAVPRRWLLISREMGVPSEEEGSDCWSVDHLFVDQDAIPTLIEVKRSSDTRIRREVVGQMLDYTANAVVYLPVETIRARFEEDCRQRGVNSEKEIEDLRGPEAAGEDFWELIKTNLRAGRIRMVFVADLIPPQLRCIVEFLSRQMDPAQVFAVEIKQFVGKGLKTLVPRLIGQTVEAERKKGGSRQVEKRWDEVSFLEALEVRKGEAVTETARSILAWAKKSVLRIWWGKGSKDGSFYPVLDHEGEGHLIVSIWTYGKVEIQFQYMLKRKPFDEQKKRIELLTRLNQISGIEISEDAITRRPSFPLDVLAKNGSLVQFLSVLDWYVAEVKGV